MSPFYGALDRFAQFFIAPLFLEETLDRELRAVDSENKKNLQSDTWRLMQLQKSLSNPKHPFCHFSTGNLQTLRDEPLSKKIKIREEFIRFHREQYSANRMKLVVLGRESLKQLQDWVEDLFSGVKNKELPQNRWDGVPLLTEKELRTQVFAKPVMDSRNLEIMFQYQDEDDMYDTQPGRYLSHLIGHEGPGSILAYVKARGWANSLSAGSWPVCPGSALFSVTLSLTPDGLKNYQEVTKSVFQYLSILHETPPQEWIFNELITMGHVDFKYKQKSSATSTTSDLSQTMQKPLPRDRIVSGERLIRSFDSQAIAKATLCLTVDNARVTLVSQEPLPGEAKKEKWYGTEYSIQKMPKDFLEALKQAEKSNAAQRPAELHLPHPNEFLPSRLDVDKKPPKEPLKAPKLIRNDQSVRVWFKKDDQFWVPKANVMVTLRNPVCGASPKSLLMANLLSELVEDELNEYAYDADIAGLSYGMYGSSLGFHITLSGYNDKLAVLLEKVLTTMNDLDIKQDRFEIIKERMLRNYYNYEYSNPYRQIGQYARWLGSEKAYITETYLNELKAVSVGEVRAFRPVLLQQLHIEALIQGNVYREDALKLADLVEKKLGPQRYPESHWLTRRSIVLPKGSNFLYQRELKDPSNVNHCIEYMLQIGHCEERDKIAKLYLLAQIADEPAFDQLRTKEQLGYVVFSGAIAQVTTAVFHVLIQSEKHAEYLEKRIEHFLNLLQKEILDMSEERFESHKKSVINKKLEKLKNLNQEGNRFWGHISNEFYHFEQIDDDVARIKPLTKPQMIEFFDKYIDPSSKERSKLSIHLVAKSSPEDLAKEVSPSEQMQGIQDLLSQLLASHSLPAEGEKLSAGLAKYDVLKAPQKIADAMFEYLTEDTAVPKEVANSLVEQLQALLPTVLPQIGLSLTKQEKEEPNGIPFGEVGTESSQVPTLIEDVHTWKASMQLSSGPKPLKDLSKYEDVEPKL